MPSDLVDPTSTQAATLLGFTRLIARWSSLELQRSIAAECGIFLDATAVRTLYLLGISGGSATPSVIADELHLSRPSTSKLIARLTDAGLFTRRPDPSDRRSALISFTDAGHATFTQLFTIGLSMVNDITQEWADGDRQQLATLLTRFVDGLSVDAEPAS